jgi:hypothetical protein
MFLPVLLQGACQKPENTGARRKKNTYRIVFIDYLFLEGK